MYPSDKTFVRDCRAKKMRIVDVSIFMDLTVIIPILNLFIPFPLY